VRAYQYTPGYRYAARQTIADKEVRLTARAAGSSTEEPVASLSKALDDFSVGIANLIRELVQADSTQSAVARERSEGQDLTAPTY